MIDRHYIKFRHGTHFSRQYSCYVSLPMQSKTLLRLHHMTFDVFKNTKLIFDLLYLCSAEVAQFPFEDDQRNQDREKLFEDLVVRDCSLPKTDITLGRDLNAGKLPEKSGNEQGKRLAQSHRVLPCQRSGYIERVAHLFCKN